jgi:hypothetical protein
MKIKELIKWLKENSSGDYRPSFEAAERLEQMSEALECLALDLRNAANGHGIGNLNTMANLAESCLD